jgi:carboxyl-terminal processing protease
MHPGKTSQEKFTLTREKIHVDTLLGDRRKPNGDWQYMFDPKLRIGYIRLTAFSRDTPSELQGILTQLQKEKMRGLILDMRFNPGGLLSGAIEVSDLFVAEGRIVSTKGRNSPERAWDARKENTFLGFPMVVLVNRYSASSSEIVAACLQDHKRAVIVGQRTWGKGSVQSLIELGGGKSAIKITTSIYCRPSGKNIHHFPNAKDSGDWGVSPNSGFEIAIGESEMNELIQDRRNRDILQPPTVKDSPSKAVPASTPTRPAFADRQFQAALKHLTAEIAK